VKFLHRARILAHLLVLPLFCASATATTPAEPAVPASSQIESFPEFEAWRAELRQDALARGISAQTFDQALAGFQPLPRVIELDQRQPEFVDTFWNYLDRRVENRRVALGQEQLRGQTRLLRQIRARYGIPPTLLVAFWGLETNFGATTGNFPVPHALATLAYDNRRSAFFRGELLNALKILEQGHISLDDMKGSWAGAMGQMQFMPSTFQRYAVDADGDKRKDIWRSLPDAFHSGANYLKQIGWQPNEIWGREVLLPEDFDVETARLEIRKPLREWSALGVRQADGKKLPKVKITGAILLPQGHDGPAFLVYRNFDVIMQWNRSINYALSVGHLADRLNGAPALTLGRNTENLRLTREQLIEIQQQLSRFGYDPGNIDGIPGSKTRVAIRAYQKAAGLPPDGHASARLLEYMRKEPAMAVPESALASTLPLS
jgi:membrane-bound lytic murein transglycosylase B